MIAAYIFGKSKDCDSRRTKNPRPEFDPSISAATRLIQPPPIASRYPVMTVGEAIGSLIEKSVLSRPAPSSAAASTRLRSIRSRPTMVLRSAAGHAVQNMIATLERRPIPSARMNSGKRASAEMGRMKSTIGIIIDRATRLREARIPMPVPIATAAMNPSATIWILEKTCGIISPLASTRHMASMMTSGVGRNGLRSAEAAICHSMAMPMNGTIPLLNVTSPTTRSASSPYIPL